MKTTNETARPVASIEEEIIAKASTGIKSLPMLDVIFSRLPVALTSAFKVKAGILAEASLKRVHYGTWGTILGGMDEYAVHAIADASPWSGSLILSMDPDFFYSAIETQLNGTPAPGKAPKRYPSTIERRLAKTLADIIFSELSENFARLMEVRFRIDSIENGQQIVSHLASSASCVMCAIEIRIADCVGMINIIIPLSTIEPAQPKLTKMFLGEKLGGDATWREHISASITSSSVQVQAKLAEFSVNLLDVMEWRVGSTIDLGVTKDDDVTIVCSGMPILHGKAGRWKHGKAAVRVSREEGETLTEVDA